MKCCSLVSLKTYIQEPSTDFDTLLGQILDDVSARMEGALNRILRTGTYTEYFKHPCKSLFVKARPVASITSITFSGSVLPADWYSTDLASGTVYFIDWLTETESWQQLKVIYVGGYAYDVEPNADVLTAAATDLHLVRIAGAVRKQAAKEFLRRKELGILSFTMPDGSLSVMESAPWLPEVMDVINLERRPCFG